MGTSILPDIYILAVACVISMGIMLTNRKMPLGITRENSAFKGANEACCLNPTIKNVAISTLARAIVLLKVILLLLSKS
jgi:hypothetical protein